MKKNKDKTMILAGSIILTVIIAGMIVYTMMNCDYRSIISTMKSAKVAFIIPALLCAVIFVLCESMNIRRVCRALGYGGNVFQYITYGAAGFFFSGITPSSSGGQPMQLYCMHKDGILISHGFLSLFTELLGFQSAGIILALFGLIYNRAYVASFGPEIKLLLGAGMCICFIILALTVIAVLFPASPALKIIRKFAKTDNYEEGSAYIRANPVILLKTVLTSLVQMAASFSIPYFVYMALGMSGFDYLQIMTLQATLSVGISIVPVPGTAGVAEKCFMIVFAAAFGQHIMPGMILSRGINFYLMLLMTGIYLAAGAIIRRAKKGRGNGEKTEQQGSEAR